MSSRYTKKIPEFIYFVGKGEWIQGPFVHPKRGQQNRKFKLTEIHTNNEFCPACKTGKIRQKHVDTIICTFCDHEFPGKMEEQK
jgi:hypothetical protein